MVSHKTPVTLSAAERQSQLAREGKIPASSDPKGATRSSVTSDDIRARLNAGRQEEFAAAAARNLVPEHRFPKAAIGLKPDDEFEGATMTLETSKIRSYDRDPRRSINPRYSEIKESIRIKGVLNPITVTRRPGSPDYMVYGGGNTRLKLTQELDLEHPGNPLYSHMKVVYRTWRGEADVIAAHIVENEARGDTTFWDKACGLISLKKELEAETNSSLTSNDVRLKAATLGWKVSRDVVQLYDFATEWLHLLGPWLTFGAARLLKDRIGALLSTMKQLDMQGGLAAFMALLSEELTLQATRLKAAQENQGLGPSQVEADAVQICSALEERVANATGTSVPELRQMLAILAANPQASATQLRAEAAKGVVVARGTSPKTSTEPSTAAAPARQIPLPTPMLAAVPPPPAADPVNDAEYVSSGSGLPSLENQGELPPELASAGRVPADDAAGEAQPLPVQAATALLEAIRYLAASTLNTDLMVIAPRMPLGYFMEMPEAPLQSLSTVPLPETDQVRLRKAGWQLLATISSQFDQRCCNAQCMPETSRWLQAVRSDGIGEALTRCGVSVLEGRLQIDAEYLFYILTEPRLLSPAVGSVLRALAVRQGTRPSLLPPGLELVTAKTGQTV